MHPDVAGFRASAEVQVDNRWDVFRHVFDGRQKENMSIFDRYKRTPPDITASPQPDQAWKALSITNEWIRHSDTKTAATLAFVGFTATLMFNLLRDLESWTCALSLTTVLGVGALLGAIWFSGTALLPRLKAQTSVHPDAAEDTVSLLFFGDIARHYADDGPSYSQVLSLLTADPERLTQQIASQIHVNARIATLKFHRVNRAIISELVAVAALAGIAVIRVAGW